MKTIRSKIEAAAKFPRVMQCSHCDNPSEFVRINADNTARFKCLRCGHEDNPKWVKQITLPSIFDILKKTGWLVLPNGTSVQTKGGKSFVLAKGVLVVPLEEVDEKTEQKQLD